MKALIHFGRVATAYIHMPKIAVEFLQIVTTSVRLPLVRLANRVSISCRCLPCSICTLTRVDKTAVRYTFTLYDKGRHMAATWHYITREQPTKEVISQRFIATTAEEIQRLCTTYMSCTSVSTYTYMQSTFCSNLAQQKCTVGSSPFQPKNTNPTFKPRERNRKCLDFLYSFNLALIYASRQPCH